MKSNPILRYATAALGLIAAVAIFAPNKADAQCYPETRYYSPSYHDYGHTRVVSRAPVYYRNATVYVNPVPRVIVRHSPIVRHVRRPIVRHAHRRHARHHHPRHHRHHRVVRHRR